MIDRSEGERFWIEWAAPLQDVFVLLVFGVGHRFQIILVPERPTHILRWCAALTSDATRIMSGRLRQQDGFQQQIMPPVVPKIVDVLKLSTYPRHYIVEVHPAFVNHLSLIQVVIGVRHAVKTAPDDKLVEVVIFPVHDDLQYGVQACQSYKTGKPR